MRSTWSFPFLLALVACSGGAKDDAAVPDTGEPPPSGTTPDPIETDADGDGFAGVEHGGPDCDDADDAVHPEANDVCNGVDDDCSGLADDDPRAWSSAYLDGDGDGVGGEEIAGCDLSDDLVEDGGDCDDADPTRFPGAEELCNGVDDDCDPETVEAAEVDGHGYPTIQAAIDAAADGDTVTVCDGTFTELLTVPRDLVIASANGPEATVLDGMGQGSVIRIVDATVELVGLTVRNGATDSFDDGGGVNGDEAVGAVTVTDCVFEANVGDEGGAIYANEVVAIRSVFRENEADYGAAIRVEDGRIEVIDSVFERNVARYGGALAGRAPMVISGSTFVDNVATSSGGAVWGDSDVTITTSTFTGNEAYYGGAVYFEGGSHTADAATRFEGNTAVEEGGAVSLKTSSYILDVAWTGGTFVGNSVGGGLGGAFYGWVISRDRSITISGVVADGNDAGTGGAVYLDGGPALVADAVLVNNTATGDGGGVSVVSTGAQRVTLARVELRGNAAARGGGIALDAAELTVEDGVILANVATVGGGGASVGPGARLTSVGADWGIDPDDNAPDDVRAGSDALHVSYETLGEDFVCSGDVPACQ